MSIVPDGRNLHSVALLHLHVCTARPINATPDTIEATAERMADAIAEEMKREERDGAP